MAQCNPEQLVFDSENDVGMRTTRKLIVKFLPGRCNTICSYTFVLTDQTSFMLRNLIATFLLIISITGISFSQKIKKADKSRILSTTTGKYQ